VCGTLPLSLSFFLSHTFATPSLRTYSQNAIATREFIARAYAHTRAHTHTHTHVRSPGCAIITRFYEAKNHIGHVRTRPAAARTINNAAASSDKEEEEEEDRTLRAAPRRARRRSATSEAKQSEARRASERAERVNMAAPRVSGPPRSLRVAAVHTTLTPEVGERGEGHGRNGERSVQRVGGRAGKREEGTRASERAADTEEGVAADKRERKYERSRVKRTNRHFGRSPRGTAVYGESGGENRGGRTSRETVNEYKREEEARCEGTCEMGQERSVRVCVRAHAHTATAVRAVPQSRDNRNARERREIISLCTRGDHRRAMYRARCEDSLEMYAA